MTVASADNVQRRSIDLLLRQMTELGASDLHLRSSRRPLIRLHGRLQPMDGDPLRASDIGSMMDAIMQPHHKAKFEKNLSVDLGYGIPGLGALPLQRVPAARHAGGVLPHDPGQDQGGRGPGASRVAARLLPPPDGPGADHRSHRQRQVDHALDPGAVHRRSVPGPRRHHRGPHRVPAARLERHHLAARGGDRHAELRRSAQELAAPGSRRDHGRRDARPGDGVDRHHRRRDRPPGLLDAAHQRHRADHRPHPRQLPARAADPGPLPALAGAARRGVDAAGAPSRRHGPHRGARDPAHLARRREV